MHLTKPYTQYACLVCKKVSFPLAAVNFPLILVESPQFLSFMLTFFYRKKIKISKNEKKTLETLIKVITNVVRLHRRVKKRFSFELIRHDLPL